MKHRYKIAALGALTIGAASFAFFHRKLHRVFFVPDAPSRAMVAGEPQGEHREVTVYFVGHSLIGEAIPEMLVAIGVENDVRISYASQLIDGGTLMRNWEEAETSRHFGNVDESLRSMSAQEALESGSFDTVVLTEAVNLDDSLRWSASEEFAANFYRAAIRGASNCRLFFYETWHHHDADRSIDIFPSNRSWREQLSDDLDKWEHIVDGAQSQVETPIHIVPGGQLMAALIDAVEAEEAPAAFTSREVFFSDNVHLSPLGAYAISLVMFKALTGVDPVEVPSELANSINLAPEDANWLARLAIQVASTYPRTFATPNR